MNSIPTQPKILYHYCAAGADSYAFKNLCQQVVYYGVPAKFNDPYDCLIAPYLPKLSKRQCLHLMDCLYEKDKDVYNKLGFSRDTFSSMLTEEGIPRLANTVNKMLLSMQRQMREENGVVCFSEANDNLLMWSHYADHGAGICLAFDTEVDPIFAGQRIKRVCYSATLPDIDAYEILTSGASSIGGLTYKSQDWAYEREWRLFGDAQTTEKYNQKTLVSVYIGTNADEETQKRVYDTVKEIYPHAQLWQGRLSERRYAVKFDKFLP